VIQALVTEVSKHEATVMVMVMAMVNREPVAEVSFSQQEQVPGHRL
jgi:hypothetical protein